MATETITEWVCDDDGPCLCNGANPDACDCDRTPTIAGTCSKCGATMVSINVDTGEPVEAAS